MMPSQPLPTQPQPPPQPAKKKRETPAEYAAWLRSFGYNFRLNEISDQIENNGVPISDEQYSRVEWELIAKGCDNERYGRIAVNTMAYDNRYNPVKEYLSKLPYDGGNYFDDLIACFDNPDRLIAVYLRKWMLGAVAKVIQGSQNRMLILDGPQGAGKSLFVKWLCSGLPDYFNEGSIDVESNDTRMRLTSKWIWEVGELGHTMRNADREALKNLITQATMTFRRPYGHFDKTKPVLASLVGTINNTAGFLDDTSGSRRFMVCEVKKVNWKEYLKIDVNKLWGEIYAAFLIGEDTEFTPQQTIQAEKNNQQYEITDPIEIVMHDQFTIRPGDNTLWTSTAELMYAIMDKLGKGGSPKSFQMSLAATCKHLGLEKGRQNQWGYYGIGIKLP